MKHVQLSGILGALAASVLAIGNGFSLAAASYFDTPSKAIQLTTERGYGFSYMVVLTALSQPSRAPASAARFDGRSAPTVTKLCSLQQGLIASPVCPRLRDIRPILLGSPLRFF
jgi:hypothetical protein